MNNKKLLSLGLCSILLLSGCGSNESMYEVKKEPIEISEENDTKVGYGKVDAEVASDADADAGLPKKFIVMIDGKPIAQVEGTYTNSYGYVNSEPVESSTSDAELENVTDDSKTEKVENVNEEVKQEDSVKTLDIVAKTDYEVDRTTAVGKFTIAARQMNFETSLIDFDDMPNGAEVTSNKYDAKSIVTAYNKNTENFFGMMYTFNTSESAKTLYNDLKNEYSNVDDISENEMTVHIKSGEKSATEDGMATEDSELEVFINDNTCVIMSYTNSNQIEMLRKQFSTVGLL